MAKCLKHRKPRPCPACLAWRASCGGRVKTAKKARAVRQNLVKARANRWPLKMQKEELPAYF